MARLLVVLGVLGTWGCCRERCERVSYYDDRCDFVAYRQYDDTYTYRTEPYRHETVYESTYTRPGYRLTGDQPSSMDAGFVRDVTLDNLAEIEMGRLATRNASSEQVRSFGQRMIDTHTQAQADLDRIAARTGLDTPDRMASNQDRMVSQLSGLSGTNFDRQYIDMMVREHQNHIAKFEHHARTASEGELRNFANSMLPKLREHLREAREIQMNIGG